EGPADRGVVIGDKVRRGSHRRLLLRHDQVFAGADAARTVVVGVAAVDGLPEVVTGGVEGDRVGVGYVPVGHRDRAGVLGALTAGVVGVDGVGHRAAGVRGGAGQRRRVVHGSADLDGGRRQRGRDRRRLLRYDQVFAGADASGRIVVGVAAVDGLPVEVTALVEGDRVGVGHHPVGHSLRPGALRVIGA